MLYGFINKCKNKCKSKVSVTMDFGSKIRNKEPQDSHIALQKCRSRKLGVWESIPEDVSRQFYYISGFREIPLFTLLCQSYFLIAIISQKFYLRLKPNFHTNFQNF